MFLNQLYPHRQIRKQDHHRYNHISTRHANSPWPRRNTWHLGGSRSVSKCNDVISRMFDYHRTRQEWSDHKLWRLTASCGMFSAQDNLEPPYLSTRTRSTPLVIQFRTRGTFLSPHTIFAKNRTPRFWARNFAAGSFEWYQRTKMVKVLSNHLRWQNLKCSISAIRWGTAPLFKYWNEDQQL